MFLERGTAPVVIRNTVMHALLLILLAFQPQDETLEKARKLLEESAAKLKAAPAIAFTYELTQGWTGSPPSTSRSRLVLQGPDRLRWEYFSTSGEWLQIYDGRRIWHYDKMRAEYTASDQNR